MSATMSSYTARMEGPATTMCAACAQPPIPASFVRSSVVKRPAAVAPTPAREHPHGAPQHCCCWPCCWGQAVPWCSRGHTSPPTGLCCGDADTTQAIATNIENTHTHSNTVYKRRGHNWTKPYLSDPDSTSVGVETVHHWLQRNWQLLLLSLQISLPAAEPIADWKGCESAPKRKDKNKLINQPKRKKKIRYSTVVHPSTALPSVWTNQIEAFSAVRCIVGIRKSVTSCHIGLLRLPAPIPSNLCFSESCSVTLVGWKVSLSDVSDIHV